MAVVGSGQIDLNQIHVEAGGGSGTQCTQGDADIRGLIGKAASTQSALSEWYGASSAFTTVMTPGATSALLYTDGFYEQCSRTHQYATSITPTSDLGTLANQTGMIPNSNGVTWACDTLAVYYNAGAASTSAAVKLYFRDSTTPTNVHLAAQEPHYLYAWPMGNVTFASDANFTQGVLVVPPSQIVSVNSASMQFNSWISGVGWHLSFASNAERTASTTLFQSTVYVKIENP